MKRLHIITGLALLSVLHLQAQQFGAFPPSVKWKQIDTDTARIIFPSAVDSQAQQIAAIIHKIITQRPNSLGSEVRKINILLHNNTTLANGYVSLAPFRSEYYLVPGSDVFEFGANPWYQELAVHEFRHVLQFSNWNKGLSKFGSVILGEEGQALFNAIAIPDWFWEGDATHAETALTPQGRGRVPFFFNGYTSLWREGRNYSWMKLRSGSLKDYVPDHYQLGYLLVNYGYLKYGNDFWRKVTSDAVSFKGVVYPFQQAIKKYSGVNYRTFRKEALSYYSHEVSRKRTDSLQRATVTNYYYPQYIGNDSLLYVKSSYRTLPAFYIKDRDGEHRLRLRNITTENWISYRNGTIAYTAFEADARWSLRDYSSIYLVDIHSGRQERITHKEKYFTPDISPSGQKIIAVHVDESTETDLHVMDRSGAVSKRIKPSAHSNFLQPKFIDESSIVVVERLPNSTMQLSRIDLSTENKEVLIPSTSALIGYPYYYKGTIYFVSSVAGNDDIYSIRLTDKKISKLVSGNGGNYYPTVYNDSLTWVEFTSNGLLLKEKAAGINGTDVDAQRWMEVTFPFAIANADAGSNVLTNIDRKFPVQKYPKGSHLFNFHSWRPDYSDPEFTLSFFSDNMLNTFTNELYYRYNQNETSHAFGWNTSYGGFYPMINAGVEANLGRTILAPTGSFQLNTLEARIGYNIPLNFSGKRMYRFFNIGSDLVVNHTTSTSNSKDFYDFTNKYLHHFISWSHYLPQARQHIYPKFGYTAVAHLRHLINDGGWTFSQNSQWLLGAQLFLPSIRNHSLVITGAYQRVDSMSAIFSNRFSMSRGYDDYYYRTMWRVSGNYHFPIFYPDWGFGNIIFFQRVRGNIFYDYTKVYSGYFGKQAIPVRTLRSTGIEIYFDSKVWNELPVSFGFRVSHLLDNGRNQPRDARGSNWFEFIVPVDIIPTH